MKVEGKKVTGSVGEFQFTNKEPMESCRKRNTRVNSRETIPFKIQIC
jgi:hypothetical protein